MRLRIIASMKTTSQTLNELSCAGLSQMEISRRTGIPQPRLSRWLKGDVPAGADDALKLAALLRAVEADTSSEHCSLKPKLTLNN